MGIARSQTLDTQVESYSQLPEEGTFTSAPATGELLVIWGGLRFPEEANATVEVTDNKGNTYTVVQRSERDPRQAGDDQIAFVAYCIHAGSGSGTHTVTINLSSAPTGYSLRGGWGGRSYSGVASTSFVDISTGNQHNTSATSLSVTTATLAQAAELVCSVWCCYQSGDTDLNVTTPATFTNQALGEATTGYAFDDKITSATTPLTVTYSYDTAGVGAMVVVSFKEAASTGNTIAITTSPIEVAVGAAINVVTRVMNGGSPVSGASVTLTSNLPDIAQVLDDTPSSGSVTLTCVPGATQTTSPYQSDNNTWGASAMGTTPWSQCAGLSAMQSGSKVNFRTTWSWPDVGSSAVKAYPEIIYGQKPGHTEVGTTILPIKIDDIVSCTASWDGLTETLVGARGQFTFDLWLQADATAYTSFYAAPKTHEIMLPISAYGTPQYGVPPNRNPAWLKASNTNVTVDSRAFNIYDTGSRNFGDSNNPWRFVVYQPLSLSGGAITSATINWRTIFTDMKNRGICTGQEYLVAIEIGVEPIYGQGDSLLTGYKVVMS